MMNNPLAAIIASERAYAALPYTESGTNVQRFSDAVNAAGLAGCQGQAWCATYQFAVELETVGKTQALKNWHMTGGYVGYSCFDTYRVFERVGKVGKVPKVGALVIFKRSHMGRVLSVDGGTFECGEGNTSNRQFDRDGDCCAVKTYRADDAGIKGFCYIDYKETELTPTDVVRQAAQCYTLAHNGHYRYGDSHALPPTSDGIISCERLIALMCWRMGYVNQPRGGITVLNMERFLLSWGWVKITTPTPKAGDIVLMRATGTSAPTAAWHTFVVASVNANGTINKYDMGSQTRIDSKQPFTGVPLDEWSNREFYCIFRVTSDEYVFTPSALTSGDTNNSAYLATEILKARGYKGIYDRKKQKELELNFRWTIGDMAAAAQAQADRMKRGVRVNAVCGEINAAFWFDLLGMLPFKAVELPTRETKGLSVLLCQEILRARGILGADGQPLKLDREWGQNTAHAVRQYQAARKLPVTGIVDVKTWADMVNIV